MEKNILLFLLLFITSSLSAQVLLEDDFEGASLPEGWTQQTMASDGGWVLGSASALSSQYWPIADNGSQIIATNDDQCNCDKIADYLILPTLDFTDAEAPIIEFDLFYGQQAFNGVNERAYVEVSTDGGMTWTQVIQLEGVQEWFTTSVSLIDYAGMSDVLVAIRYNDQGAWLYGIAIDNVKVKEQIAKDVELSSLDLLTFGETDNTFPIKGSILNKGIEIINSIQMSYTVNDGTPITTVIENLTVGSFETYDYELEGWMPTEPGMYTINVTIDLVNGSEDLELINNNISTEIEIFEKVVIPNRIDEYVEAGGALFTEIGSASDELEKPTDLDFFPILGKYELWVINEREESDGGSTVTFFNAGKEDQEELQRVDGNAWHFMSLPTGIAFAESGFFGTSPGVQDANHSGGTFTGPTLWTSDEEIYARPSGGNGSHMDMLHGSPFSMGIAHEIDNVYWLYDGYNGHPVRYDFVEDHGPGNDDHSDGRVQRFTEIELKREGAIPSHLVLDKPTGWLYIADVGNDRVLRLNINSGSVMQPLDLINEPLAEHSEMHNLEWEVIIDSGLEQPCGIEVIENRLLVGDYATGDIVIYDIENNFEELGRIATGNEGLTGIKLGPEGRIWFTNRLLHQVNVAEPNAFVSNENLALESAVSIAPNPTRGAVQITFDMPFDGELNIRSIEGRLLEQYQINDTNIDIDLNQYRY